MSQLQTPKESDALTSSNLLADDTLHSSLQRNFGSRRSTIQPADSVSNDGSGDWKMWN